MSQRGKLIVPITSFIPNIDCLIVELMKSEKQSLLIPADTIYYLCSTIRTIFMSQPVFLALDAPLTIVGDIHGQFFDLLRIFYQNGIPPDKKYLFLGDYVDRGKNGVEVLCLLYALKIKYPEHIYLIRGNHETACLNRFYGFYDECLRKYGNLYIWNAFISTFNVYPFAALINDKILCIHGGLSPLLKKLDQIKRITRPVDIPEEGLICDLVWADPSLENNGFSSNNRGTGCAFGMDVLNEFLNENNLQLLIRAHEMVDGFTVLDGVCVTVFSAPYYCGTINNSGAYVTISTNLTLDFHKFGTEKI
ncbi:Ser/Thr protein phosphatase family protein [Entamoeba histolytica HM-1:IMSS-B]|uniref:Serine/threonine-protein phosphatase n=6 Tax=Entamoeba histolytica TaxID=5759 RepID=C4M495_ENTH1|nr:protein phosphatase, putative [Entamoeba histolytica HM-1:IMSS]EMD48787.1 protein phosphatase, putative [Entamoeba histolytica KU27]EMH77011.1 Ser/Thr protein phosphatase family protein [Entamoeba histolytica HM-1:IMSS-B]ENY62945.1 protein phosphatase, putative [Entamoeba histolytica HM-1:IMSS-A]GAT96179.1 Ser Thr protein phosphatase family protein [Entamoeba histolytica]EAL45669.2 protein phosphatase, putative [Entamoeba histolytica HM-1:IMSS]|eukprot:XP_651055.2 protein phosphatase, putative [Entamoeba histolytica HM-1:IMSS]